MGLLGGKESGWTKMPEQKGGKEKGKKIRFYVLDPRNGEKARESLSKFHSKTLEHSVHGLGEDITKTPYLIRKGHALYCTSVFPVLRSYAEEKTKEAEQATEKEGHDEEKLNPLQKTLQTVPTSSLAQQEQPEQSSPTLPLSSGPSYPFINEMTGHTQNTNHGFQAGQATISDAGGMSFGREKGDRPIQPSVGSGGSSLPSVSPVSKEQSNEELKPYSPVSPSSSSSGLPSGLDDPLRSDHRSKRIRQDSDAKEQSQAPRSQGKRKRKNMLWSVFKIAKKLFAWEFGYTSATENVVEELYKSKLSEKQKDNYLDLAREIREDKNQLKSYMQDWKTLSFLTMKKRIEGANQIQLRDKGISPATSSVLSLSSSSLSSSFSSHSSHSSEEDEKQVDSFALERERKKNKRSAATKAKKQPQKKPGQTKKKSKSKRKR